MQVGIFKTEKSSEYGASLQGLVLSKALEKQSVDTIMVTPKEDQDFETLPEHILSGKYQYKPGEIQELGRQVLPIADAPFLLNKEEYDELKVDIKVPEPFILSYMVERNPKMVFFSERMSRALGRPIVQRKQHEIFINELKNVKMKEEGELLSLIEQAELIITNSYFVAAYAMIYKKPFVAMPKKPEGNPLAELLKDMGATSHLLLISRDFDDLGDFAIRDENRLDTAIATKNRMALDDLRRKLDMEVAAPVEKKVFAQENEASVSVPEETSIERVNQKITVVANSMDEYMGLPKLYDLTKKEGKEEPEKKAGDILIKKLMEYFLTEISGSVVFDQQSEQNGREHVFLEESMDHEVLPIPVAYVEPMEDFFAKVKELLLLGKYVLLQGDHKCCIALRKYLGVNHSRLLLLEQNVPKNISFFHAQRYLEHFSGNDDSISKMVMRDRSIGFVTDKCEIVLTDYEGIEKIITSKEDSMLQEDFKTYQQGFSSPDIADIPGNIGDITFYRDEKGEIDDLVLINSPIGEKFFDIASLELKVEAMTCQYELSIAKSE